MTQKDKKVFCFNWKAEKLGKRQQARDAVCVFISFKRTHKRARTKETSTQRKLYTSFSSTVHKNILLPSLTIYHSFISFFKYPQNPNVQ